MQATHANEIVAPMVQSLKEQQKYSLEVIDQMSQDICASIPWCLGFLHQGDLPPASRASLAITGLRAVATCTFTRQHHVVEAKRALEEISGRFGIKSASM